MLAVLMVGGDGRTWLTGQTGLEVITEQMVLLQDEQLLFPFSVWLVVRSLTDTFVRATELHRSADRWQLTPQWYIQLCLNSGCKVFLSIVGMLATGDQMPLRRNS